MENRRMGNKKENKNKSVKKYLTYSTLKILYVSKLSETFYKVTKNVHLERMTSTSLSSADYLFKQ